MKKTFTLFIPILLVLILFSCAKKDEDVKIDPSKLGNDKEIFEKAAKVVKRQPERARLLYKNLIQLYPNSIYAQKAKINIADSHFNEKGESNLMLAVSEYEEFVNMYPNSPDAIYAKYQVGECFYRRMRKPGRDQDNTYKAIEAFENMIKRFPQTKKAEDAKEKIKKARINLAMHYFRIGMSNYYLKSLRGAIDRFKQVLNDFPDFELKERLFFFTGKAYYGSAEFETATTFFQRTISSFPKSKFAVRSRRMLKKVEKASKEFEAKKKKIETKTQEK